jgi:hypothetical protein
MERQLERDLLDLQGLQGGVAASPGAPWNIEATALASLVLPDEPAARARDWLLALQLETGGWAWTEEIPEPSWATPLALIALERRAPLPSAALERGLRWLVAREGRPTPWLARLWRLLLPPDRTVEQDFSLQGWPWNETAQAWVEPTAFALIALRKLAPRFSLEGAGERIREGEALIRDRACDGGGWNYGNKRVLGEHLEPFADVTAFALLALHGTGADVEASLDRLEELLRRESSGLALAAGALALAAHGRDASEWLARLETQYAAGGFRHEARSLAFALLALRGQAEALLP